MDLMKFKGRQCRKDDYKTFDRLLCRSYDSFYYMHHLSDDEAGKSLQPGIGHRQEWGSI